MVHISGCLHISGAFIVEKIQMGPDNCAPIRRCSHVPCVHNERFRSKSSDLKLIDLYATKYTSCITEKKI